MIKVFFFCSLILIIIFFLSYVINPKLYPKKFFISLTILLSFGLGAYISFGDHKFVNIIDVLYDDLKKDQTNDPRKLVIFLETKLAKDPYDIEGWLILARTCLITGNIQKAELYYSKARKYFPTNSDLLFETALLKINIGQIDKSLKFLLEAHELNSKSIKIKEHLIKTYLKLGKKNDAFLIFEDLKKNQSSYEKSEFKRVESLFK
tara:strand:- start:205 stop:822 length:618 start_codon:yes stop_codon:yes gene_type:complete